MLLEKICAHYSLLVKILKIFLSLSLDSDDDDDEVYLFLINNGEQLIVNEFLSVSLPSAQHALSLRAKQFYI